MISSPEALYPWTVDGSVARAGQPRRDLDDLRVAFVLPHGSRWRPLHPVALLPPLLEDEDEGWGASLAAWWRPWWWTSDMRVCNASTRV